MKTNFKSAEEWLKAMREISTSHVPECICKWCKNGQEMFLIPSDIATVQSNTMREAARIVATTPIDPDSPFALYEVMMKAAIAIEKGEYKPV